MTLEKLMVGLEELKWGPGPYPGSRMKIYPMIGGTPFFSVLIDLDPEVVLEEHQESFNEITIVYRGEALIEGKRCPEGTYFFTPAGNHHGPFTTKKGCQLLVVKFSS